MAGTFNWRRGHRAQGRLVSAASSGTEWSVETKHHGHAKRYGIVHRRFLEGLGPRSFRLIDRLERNATAVPFRWSLLVAPGLDVVSTSGGWLVRGDGTDLLMLTISQKGELRLRGSSYLRWV
jgi:hypothetical protein